MDNDNRQIDIRAWLHYKLTNEPKVSGELIIMTRGPSGPEIPLWIRLITSDCI